MTPNSSPLTPHLALIGAGYWGKNLVRNFHQLGVLKTICDQSSTIRQQMAKDYPDTTVTDDFNALLSDPDIQAVVISAPAARHHALATQALDTGKHCFVEKPHTIGRYAFIGAGAVVTKDVPDHALMVGNPARQIGWACICGEKLDEQTQCKTCGQTFDALAKSRA